MRNVAEFVASGVTFADVCYLIYLNYTKLDRRKKYSNVLIVTVLMFAEIRLGTFPYYILLILILKTVNAILKWMPASIL